ncbi:hypothetical protein [Frateuria sp. STR12]|uniref:hypothetical protein n=1 Tax=Frateuria hangzhouensis TaxID=2995589 RepID=UPI002260970B|nr:hypothetical protein [Frateuria sp. STR12]MCX7515180.1 hypothetical protein [Frateuria sp. STR12]
MQPWERRLGDLWLLLERCHLTYMEPELFRLNTNQFLQTARTVTFIIQKNKPSIPDFDSWYRPIVAEWASDEVMEWAKDSRNAIEKEGDLELHSTLELTLLFSYLAEQDLKLATGREELLHAGAKRLVRIAQKKLPSHVIGSSAIKIERVWIANSLPNLELLQALSYVYTTLYRVCRGLAFHLGGEIEQSIPDPTALYAAREITRRVCYVKLSDLKIYYQKMERVRADPDLTPPASMSGAIYELRERMSQADSNEKLHAALAAMAQQTFERDGYHIPMLFLYDKDFKSVDGISVHWSDQAEKFIFWRNVADRVIANRATIIVTIGEAWIRDMSGYHYLPIKEMPITGEELYVNLLDSAGTYMCKAWEIVRAGHESKPSLRPCPEAAKLAAKVPFYFAPTLRALGLPYPEYFDREPPRRRAN